MKRIILLTALPVFLTSLIGCSAVTDAIMNQSIKTARSTENQMPAQENQSHSKESNRFSSKSSSKRTPVMVPPHMIAFMFGTLYQIYFTWGGLYTQDSLKPGQWAKYQYSSSDKEESSVTITKAYLRKRRKASWYYLKIQSEDKWLSMEFEVNRSQGLGTIKYKNSEGQSQLITGSSFMMNNQNFNHIFQFRKMPRIRVSTPAGKFRAYRYLWQGLAGDQGKVTLFLQPRIPGYLIKWETKTDEETTRMELVAYGKRARRELKI